VVNKDGIVIGAHSRKKRDAARHMRGGPTPAERVLWMRLRGNAVGGLHFRRQQVIDGYIVDFYCHAVGLVIELDGSVHETQAEYDVLRQQAIERRGLLVMRFANERVLDDIEGVLAEILAATRERRLLT
jgi:very-short-patch-repair endonuclease